MPLPANAIIPWPGAAADIPSSFSRYTNLDGRHPRGSSVVGGTGGAATHVHSHNHAVSSWGSHTFTGSLGSTTPGAVTTYGWNLVPGNYWASPAAAHIHDPDEETASGGTLSPVDTGAASNDPPSLTVIWLLADGSRGVPDGALLYHHSALEGFTALADAQGRWLKGAAAGADGGSLLGAASHDHTLTAHQHPVSHYHEWWTTRWTSSTYQETEPLTTPRAVEREHRHKLTLQSVDQITSALSPSSSLTAVAPPWYCLWVLRNDLGHDAIISGMIVGYVGVVGALPDDWKPCNGSSGTPDLNGANRTIRGATTEAEIGTTGGSTGTHLHTIADHAHTVSTHLHSLSCDDAGTNACEYGGPSHTATQPHTHSTAGLGQSAESVTVDAAAGCASAFSTPPYRNLIWIQFRPTGLDECTNIFGQRFRLFSHPAADQIGFECQDLPGAAWSDPIDVVPAYQPDIKCLSDGRLLASVNTGGPDPDHYVSYDDGETWSAV